MALKDALRTIAQTVATIARNTLVDYDAGTRTLWISELALRTALGRRNANVGMMGFEAQATIVANTLRLDVKPKPFGPSGSLTTDELALALGATHYEIACALQQTSGSMTLLTKALPFVLDAMLGLGVTGSRARLENGVLIYAAPLPQDSWFLSLLRSLGWRQRPAVVLIRVGNGGLLIDLSDVLTPGVMLDVGHVSSAMLPAHNQ